MSSRTQSVKPRLANFTSFGLLWLITHHWLYTFTLWVGARLFAGWINMIQNY